MKLFAVSFIFFLLTTLAAEAKANEKLNVSGNVKVRIEDFHNGDKIPAAVNSYGSELGRFTEFNYSARLGVHGNVTEIVGYGVRMLFRNVNLPSKSFPGFPNGFANNNIVVDRVFISLAPWSTLKIYMGKHPNPLWIHKNFFWDGDVQPTGFSQSYQHKVNKAHSVGLILGQWFPQTSFRDTPSTLWVFQPTYKGKFGDLTVKGALSYMVVDNFDNLLTQSAGDNADFSAVNSATITGANPNFMNLMLKLKYPFGGRPLVFNMGYIRNFRAGNAYSGIDRYAVLAGLAYGKAKKKYSWRVGYAYIFKGAASVVNGWTDDSWGADFEGHKFLVEFIPTEMLKIKLVNRLYMDADGRDTIGNTLQDAARKALVNNFKAMAIVKF